MPQHSIKTRLDQGELVRVMCIGPFPDPKLVEVAGRYGELHGVWIDQEHSAIPHARMELLAMACRASGLDAFARVPPTDYATLMRPFEAGCSGVMVAQIRHLEEVHRVVQWSKYPPRGIRGLFMGNAESDYGRTPAAQHVARANAERWLAIQIETPEAVDQVDAIIAVDGVDLLFVGPADLACTLGVPGELLHPKCVDALRRVSAACRAAGKPWGIFTRDPQHAAQCRELGCQLFSLYSDLDLIVRGLKITRDQFADLYD